MTASVLWRVSRRPRQWFALGLCTVALASGHGQARAAELEEIKSLKEKAEADLSISVEKLRLKYLIALEKYQKKLAAEGDLDGALAIKSEIERATALKPSLLASKDGSGSSAAGSGATITLVSKAARLGNGTQFDAGNGLVKGWSRYGAFAAWTLKDIEPGNYTVTLNYRSGNLGGGVLSIRTSKQTEKFSIAGVGSWADPRTQEIGKIQLAASDHLTIVALQGNSREMVYVESVTLERAD
ncbi:MAG: hypothetical protein ACR2RV_00705 [Verrucomicrobiales bacterium]